MITEDMVRSALKNVYDPEIGLDVVDFEIGAGEDLGLDHGLTLILQ